MATISPVATRKEAFLSPTVRFSLCSIAGELYGGPGSARPRFYASSLVEKHFALLLMVSDSPTGTNPLEPNLSLLSPIAAYIRWIPFHAQTSIHLYRGCLGPLCKPGSSNCWRPVTRVLWVLLSSLHVRALESFWITIRTSSGVLPACFMVSQALRNIFYIHHLTSWPVHSGTLSFLVPSST